MTADPQPGRRRRTRLYALTDGRTAASRHGLTMDTVITATAGTGHGGHGSLPTEWQEILAMCPSPNGRAVAEIAARMRMRLTPMVVLLGEMLERGLIRHRPPLDASETSNVHLLMKIRDNLARL
ncbi:hypothetical protein GCM10010218_38240 [Streptomyces mashuensis]|uniref:DUF742 domain-containing protein n=1 Tax=Streptomyces mashuensis TaxID=33904 RepID=A0A919B571_9ACTN|nr:DUF742 domain-containing protein [Streptomyces mashuensis]GHF53149.1 hypothetical protein GCM10010218_38240 [Streptomyces mashuensis]